MRTPDLSPRARALLGKCFHGPRDRLTFDMAQTCPSPQVLEVLQELICHRVIFQSTDWDGAPVYRLTILGGVIDRRPCKTPAASRAYILKHGDFPIYTSETETPDAAALAPDTGQSSAEAISSA
ncbi:MAG: hypothetical protein GYB53_20460 [Rhodobacteraceae bacterium]|nr:hypothetical protein [Paracoccaceae bacterium]MBR9821691.1 hypothetical protein [Paracoccaceae bacterium]